MSELGVRSTARRREMVSEQGRAVLEHLPGIYLRLAKRITPERPIADRTTDLVIEGYPRSGNSYLASWVLSANPRLRLASHVHSIAHVHAALRHRVPVVIVVRPPEPAIASLAVFSPTLTLDRLIDRYQRFHFELLDVLDQVLISPFPITTESPELVIDALRPRMSVALASRPPGGADEVLADMDRRAVRFHGDLAPRKVSRPSEMRNRDTEIVRECLRTRHAHALEHLQGLHDQLATSPSAVTHG